MSDISFSPIKNASTRLEAGRLGIWLFLLSLGMLFGATIFAYIVVRLQLVSENDWRPADAPGLPWLLLLSTAILLLGSVTLAMANRAAARGANGARVGGWMIATCMLLVAFLLMQSVAWIDLAGRNLVFGASLYAWMFYILTGLHAIHVLAGLPPAFITTRNAFKGRYTQDVTSRAGLVYCGMYWHFLDGVWIVLYVVLLWGMNSG